MNCTTCGSALPAPTGYCGTCGQPTSAPWQSDATTRFAAVPPLATGAYVQPGYDGAGQPTAQTYGQPPPSPYGPSEPLPYGPPPGYGPQFGPPPGQPPPYGAVRQRETNRLSIIAFVLAGVALFILPVVFGVAGIAVGAAAKRREERLGKVSMIVAIVATLLSMIAGAVVRMRTHML